MRTSFHGHYITFLRYLFPSPVLHSPSFFSTMYLYLYDLCGALFSHALLRCTYYYPSCMVNLPS